MCNAILEDEELTALEQTEILISALKIIDAKKYLERDTPNFVAGIDCLFKAHPQPQLKEDVFNFFKKHYILPDSGDSTRNNTEFLFGIKFIIKTGDKELLHKIAVDLLYRLRYSFVRILCDLGMIYSSFVFFFNLIFFLSHFQCRLTKPSLQAF